MPPSASPDNSQQRSNTSWLKLLRCWIDSDENPRVDAQDLRSIDWVRIVPFVLIHLGCLGVLWVGVSPFAVLLAVGLYLLRMFAITGFYHRYFSHRTFKTSRWVQALFALIGATAVQRGALWWSAHHRHHHAHADTADDAHSPITDSFLWSHMGWFLSRAHFRTRSELIADWLRFPELRFLDRFDALIPLLFAISLFILGLILESYAPMLRTNGPQLLVWGFFVSTVALYHATFSINSIAHRWGQRTYDTPDESRNNPWLALITLGEGWHNNHHHCPKTVRQGFRWWQFDPTYYLLWLMAQLGLVWGLKPIPLEQSPPKSSPRHG